MGVTTGRASKAWIAASAFLLLPFLAVAPAAAESPECEPFVIVDSINGSLPSAVTSLDEVRLDATIGFTGDGCAVAVNQAPRLVGAFNRDIVSSGGASYSVTYVDFDNDAPTSIVAMLDGHLARTMLPSDPSDQDYRDGARFSVRFGARSENGVLLDEVAEGDHYVTLHATDGKAEAEPVRLDGPRVVKPYTSSVMAPNPSNRLVIHPIANGPTFAPPSEILPPLGLLTAGAGNGLYSYTFPIDTRAAELGARWSIGQSGQMELLNPNFEGDLVPENGIQLLGAAASDPRAHMGDGALNLAPAGAVPQAERLLGGARAFSEDGFHFANVGGLRTHYRSVGDDPSLRLRILMEADLDGDKAPDSCASLDVAPTPTDDWLRVDIDRSTPMRMWDNRCTEDVTPAPGENGPATLNDLQDDARWGLAKFLGVRVEATGGTPDSPWPADQDLLVDSLILLTGSPNTIADFDACTYGASESATHTPLQPLQCASDIGPQSGDLPTGANVANVWAHQMLPAIPVETFVPQRPYLEPAIFTFAISKSVLPPDSIEIPIAPTGRLLVVEDSDYDGQHDPQEAVLQALDGLTAAAPPRPVSLTFDLARPDGSYPLLLVYEHGLDASGMAPSAVAAFAVQRFVNDAPLARLAAQIHDHPKHTVTFFLDASDPDDAQGDLAQALGGLASWRLAFGDGQADATGTGAPPGTFDHVYRKHQDYTAVLTVTDATGAGADATVTLRIGGHPRWSDDVE